MHLQRPARALGRLRVEELRVSDADPEQEAAGKPLVDARVVAATSAGSCPKTLRIPVATATRCVAPS